MPKKSPLQQVQREGDVLKKDVDKFVEECQKFIDNRTADNNDKKLEELLKRCKEYEKKINSLSQKANKLDRVNEPSSTSKFDDTKQQEIKRLETLKVQLERISLKLEPDEIEEEYLREMSQELEEEDLVVKKDKQEQDEDVESGVSDDDEIEDVEDNHVEDENEEEEEEEVEEETKDDVNKEKEKSKEEVDGKNDSKTQTKSGEGKFGRLSIFRRSSKKKEVPTEEKEESSKKKKDKREKEKKGKKTPSEVEENSTDMKNEKNEGKIEKTKVEKKKDKTDKKVKISEKSNKKEKSSSKQSKSPEIEVDDDMSENDGKEDEDDVEESVEEKKIEKETKTGWRLFGKRDRKMKQENSRSSKEKGKMAEEKNSKRKGTDVPVKKTDIKRGKVVEEEIDEDYDEDDEHEDDEEYDDEELSEEEEEEEMTGEEEEYEEESEEEEEEEEEETEEEEEEEEEESEFEEELGGKPDENEEEEDDANTFEQGMDLFEAVCDCNAEQDGDLSFKIGDVLTIINTREDGWWTAEDEEGNRGLVPSTYLKMKKDPGDHRDIQSPEDEPETQLSRSGKVLWKGLRKAVRETSATDVLSAMGAIPSGFRPSTTAKLLKEDEYSLQYCLTPKLSKSNLFFKDLFWDPSANEIRSRNVKMQKVVVLTMIRNIPKVGVGLEVKSRHVRLCLFDGEKVVSNIHTVQATWTEVDDKSWKFSPKVTGVLPSILDGDCFIRTNSTDENLSLLIELCLSYVRTKTGEKGEFSCGWVNLPLYEPTTGAPIINKNYELDVKGGTPYEKDVEVDPSISRKASTSKFRSMLSANKQPRLSLKLLAPSKEQKVYIDCLPDTIVSSSSYLPFLSFYRKILGDALLRDRINMQNTDQIHSPVLASFPVATQYSDIMDAFRSAWAEKKRSLKRTDKRDNEQMKSQMSAVFMDVVYPLLHSTALPAYKWADIDTENERWEAIANFMKVNRESNVLAGHLLSPDTMHKPFDMSELTYDLCSLYTEARPR